MLNRLKKTTIDIPLLLLAAMCGSFSVLMLYAVWRSFFSVYSNATTQVLAIAMGFVGVLVISIIGLKPIYKYWYVITVASAASVLMTFLFGYAPGETEAQAWLPIFTGLSFQPTELYKLVFIGTFSIQLAYFKGKINRPIPLLLAVGHTFIVMAVAHLQGDDGAAIVFAVIALGMLIAAGLNIFYVIGAVVAGALFFVTIGFDLLRPYQQERILGLLNPEEYPDIMFQQTRSVTAIGSGQLFGVGLFGTEHYYVPNSHNDFIFSFIGQSTGLVGILVVLTLLVGIGIRVLILAHRCEDQRYRIMSIGVFMMIIGQAVINIAMNLALIPVVGIVLPFYSAGGSSMVGCMMALAMVAATKRR